MASVIVPLWVVVMPAVLVIGIAWYLVGRWVFDKVLDPPVQRRMRRSYERRMRRLDATDEQIEAGWQRIQEGRL